MNSVIQLDSYKMEKAYQESYTYYKEPMPPFQKMRMEKTKKEIRSAMVSGYTRMLTDQIK